jgi:hypothetical protein
MKAFVIIISVFICISCVNTPESLPPPAWAATIQSVYPRDAYITGRGSGSSIQEAETAALAEIALYFVRETNVERSTRSSWVETDGIAATESLTEENIIVESQTRLIAVRYAEDPWFNQAEKTWETLAYIERDEAWPMYEPFAKQQADTFLTLAKSADDETEAFNAVLRYGTAASYMRGTEFSAVRNFAQVLHPTEAAKLFAEADAVSAALLGKQLHAREKAVMFVDCPMDYNRIVYQAMVNTLNRAGFTVENERNTETTCIIHIEEGMQQLDSGTMFYPALTVTINGKNGAVMSFRVSGEKAGAINPDIAKRRAYTSLASALEQDFAEELQQRQKALIKD